MSKTNAMIYSALSGIGTVGFILGFSGGYAPIATAMEGGGVVATVLLAFVEAAAMVTNRCAVEEAPLSPDASLSSPTNRQPKP